MYYDLWIIQQYKTYKYELNSESNTYCHIKCDKVWKKIIILENWEIIINNHNLSNKMLCPPPPKKKKNSGNGTEHIYICIQIKKQ